ncbi:hypothetical protein [Burkholderia ubonensis]|uniref:DUF6697 domain-containing protein n=1 Tax=Burkholderia ubonensis TaxID=101571 RepID=A0ABD4E2N6_9BURK|nr:hypothetical protein [Burkholderia ubonensis]KVN85461.1 hypothetical protein WJ68_13625 [Burkholderia ubonensis]KVO04662.1 hypothetical protein WJ69_24900 [Burkholderia ubonensis]KVO24531.1 hypothetical protein WJ72_28465 [Burkholderia ubonensis]KVZ82991.1 hypothetical protein WL24_14075 [Burkholderia ubonensis]
MFEMNKNYTREFIHTACGGSKQAFLPTKNGKVVAACLRTDLNPHAPDVIICDGSASARAAGRTLANQDGAIPVFIKVETDAFRFVGLFVVSESLTVPLDYQQHVRNSGFTTGQVSRVLKMKRYDQA